MFGSIDEAIDKQEDLAKHYENFIKNNIDEKDFATRESMMQEVIEPRQLAEWLRQLNDIRHLFSVTEKIFKANSIGGLIDVVDGYDILFSEHKQLREIFKEVKADDSIGTD